MLDETYLVVYPIKNEITMKELKKYINYISSKVVSFKTSLDKAIKAKLVNNQLDFRFKRY